MNRNLLYTAMSRGTALEKVHLVSKSEKRYARAAREPSLQAKSKAVELKDGHIYCITFSDGTKYVGQTDRTVEERFKEHKESPTNEEVKKRLDGRETIETLSSFKFSGKASIDTAEKRWIARMLANGHTLCNVQHNRPAAAVPAKSAKKEAKSPDITIHVDETKKRFEIKVNRRNIEPQDRVKRFTWGDDKDGAYRRAEEWRRYILSEYFLGEK